MTGVMSLIDIRAKAKWLKRFRVRDVETLKDYLVLGYVNAYRVNAMIAWNLDEGHRYNLSAIKTKYALLSSDEELRDIQSRPWGEVYHELRQGYTLNGPGLVS